MCLACATAASVMPFQSGTISSPGRFAAPASSYTSTPWKVLSPTCHSTGSACIFAAQAGATSDRAREIRMRFIAAMARLLGIGRPSVARRPRAARSGEAEPGNGADRLRIEAGQAGEVAAAFGVVAVRAEARRTGREQHHAAPLQRGLRLRDGRGKVL